MPKFLFFDYETFSLADVTEVGTDNYAKNPSTGVSVVAYALDEEEISWWTPDAAHKMGPPPAKLIDALRDPSIIKIAWNATFEYNITNYVMTKYVPDGIYVPMEQYRDPIVLAHNLSLPGKLERVAEILHMEQLKVASHNKDEEGNLLKNMFSLPVSKGGENTLFGIAPPLFRDGTSHPKEFNDYIQYCCQDVRAMRDLWYRMSKMGFPERDWQGWLLDQKINRRGMHIRRDLAEKGLRLALRFIKEQRAKLKELTKLENPNSDPQMKAWAQERGYPWNSLRSGTVAAELKNPTTKMTPECKEAFKIRKSARKSSYTKIETLLQLLSSDDMLRYQFRYMGAARTGRWASGGGDDASVQVQNLPRGEKAVKKNLKLALELLDKEDYDGILAKFTNTANPKDSITVVEFVITLLRSLIQARPGNKIVVADKNAIENRVLGWVAGCDAILDVFRTCNQCGLLVTSSPVPFLCPKCGCKKARCPYLSFGSLLYDKPYEQMWATYAAGNEEERQNSKPPVLGAGYGLGGGELYVNEYEDEVRGGLWGYALQVCGVDMPKELAHKGVKIFREKYPQVTTLWSDLEEAFKQVLTYGGCIKVGEVTWDKQNREWVEHPKKGQWCVLTFTRHKMADGGYLVRLQLPSGRALHYLNATIESEDAVSKKTGRPYTKHTIFYDGIEHSATQGADGKQQKKKHVWGRVKTYGGKLTENVVQAISRDDLLNSMFLADEMGFDIWGLFHDEIATEVADTFGGLTLGDLVWCMVQVPSWAPNLILGAEGYEDKFYKKG